MHIVKIESGRKMKEIFPEEVKQLPLADIPIDGLKAWLAQEENNQVLFMEFDEDTEVQPHSHRSQWGVVLEGRMDLVIDGQMKTYQKGDRYYIPEGVEHSAKIYAGYADICFFHQKDRYRSK
jgi:quercetin dioxygenase-like cupin family protein